MNARLAAGAVLVGVVLGACRESVPSPPAAARTDAPLALALSTYDFGGDFVLTDHRGDVFDLAQERGRVHLLFFGFTMCPDVCPMTLSRIARAMNLLTSAEREQVVTLFATVDVDRDTPAVLAAHLKGFPVPVVGLAGTRAQADAVVGQYRGTYQITPSNSAAGPTISHSTYLYLIDRDGRLRHLFRLADSPELIAAGLRLALQAPRAPATAPAR